MRKQTHFSISGLIAMLCLVVSSRTMASNFETITNSAGMKLVKITKPFYMVQTEVTRAQFAQFVVDKKFVTFAEKDGRSYSIKNGEWVMVEHRQWRNPYYFQGPDHPVISVTYPDLVAFCEWLSEKEGKLYRLPTEAECEYAYRAGSKKTFPWGDSPDDGEGWGNVADITMKKSFQHWEWEPFN